MENISGNDRVSDKQVFYFRQRNRNKLFQAVLAFFAREAECNGLTKRGLAQSLGKDPAQITRWFSGPSNWTLDTVSDLLLAMDCELDYDIKKLGLGTSTPCVELSTPKSSTGTHAWTKTETVQLLAAQ